MFRLLMDWRRNNERHKSRSSSRRERFLPDSAQVDPVVGRMHQSRDGAWHGMGRAGGRNGRKRRERHTLPDVSSKGGSRELVIDPDHQANFTDLPFHSNTFALVVFDPPHFERNGATGWVGLKYGTLKGEWREELRKGIAECFRVLRHEGVLIFKWCEDEIPVSHILALTPEKPLFGHRSGKQQKTHWIAFMKQ
jgi:SAM-dependent methyltransferase